MPKGLRKNAKRFAFDKIQRLFIKNHNSISSSAHNFAFEYSKSPDNDEKQALNNW
mgnify:CR=1 FL=1